MVLPDCLSMAVNSSSFFGPGGRGGAMVITGGVSSTGEEDCVSTFILLLDNGQEEVFISRLAFRPEALSSAFVRQSLDLFVLFSSADCFYGVFIPGGGRLRVFFGGVILTL